MLKEKYAGWGEFFTELFAFALGWMFSTMLLVGAFGLGYFLTPFVSDGGHREAFGILGAMAFVWLYERQQAERRWNEINDKIDRIAENTPTSTEDWP